MDTECLCVAKISCKQIWKTTMMSWKLTSVGNTVWGCIDYYNMTLLKSVILSPLTVEKWSHWRSIMSSLGDDACLPIVLIGCSLIWIHAISTLVSVWLIAAGICCLSLLPAITIWENTSAIMLLCTSLHKDITYPPTVKAKKKILFVSCNGLKKIG